MPTEQSTSAQQFAEIQMHEERRGRIDTINSILSLLNGQSMSDIEMILEKVKAFSRSGKVDLSAIRHPY